MLVRWRRLLGARSVHVGAGTYDAAVRTAFRAAEDAAADGRLLAEMLPPPAPGAQRVAVAMSGGVDSSVAALLMRCAGFEVVGVHMNNWDTTEESDAELGTVCTANQDFADVQAVCAQLGISATATVQLSFEREYWMDVFEPSMGTLADGLTPNPDWLCNRFIKFGALCKEVLGDDAGADGSSGGGGVGGRKPLADWLCTGHYAQLQRGSASADAATSVAAAGEATAAASALPQLVAGVDATKDQSYFLCGVRREMLKRVLLPLGALRKSDVRRLAEVAGLATAHKSDSMGICFVGKRHFGAFVNQYVEPRRGAMLDLVSGSPLVTTNMRFASRVQQQLKPYHHPDDTPVLALSADPGKTPCPSSWHHDGIAQYTLGQRARLPGMARKWFVASKCLRCAETVALVDWAGGGSSDAAAAAESRAALAANDCGSSDAPGTDGTAVFAVEGTRHPALFADSAQVWAEDFNWMNGAEDFGDVRRCLARLRHQGTLIDCSVQLVPASAVPWLRPKQADGRLGCGCCADVCSSVETLGRPSAALVGLSFGLADATVLVRPRKGSGAKAQEEWRRRRARQQRKHCEAIEAAAEAAVMARGGGLPHAVPAPPIATRERMSSAGGEDGESLVLFVQFDEPQRGVAPAQILALYEKAAAEEGGALVCIGGGTVAARGPSCHALGKPAPELKSSS